MSLFWSVIALFYLVLAIVTYLMGKPVLKVLGGVSKAGDTIFYTDEEEKEEVVGLETLLHRAFKVIVITDVSGFILAAAAAIISAFLISG